VPGSFFSGVSSTAVACSSPAMLPLALVSSFPFPLSLSEGAGAAAQLGNGTGAVGAAEVTAPPGGLRASCVGHADGVSAPDPTWAWCMDSSGALVGPVWGITGIRGHGPGVASESSATEGGKRRDRERGRKLHCIPRAWTVLVRCCAIGEAKAQFASQALEELMTCGAL
jgi:hypothetical protein